MADIEKPIVAAPAAPTKAGKVKTPKKLKVAKGPKKPASHPKYIDMIKAAVASLKERGGSSRQAILKYVVANYSLAKDEKTVNSHLKLALRAGVQNGKLKQSKGSGASGSFKLGEDKTEKKPKTKKVKTTKAAAKPKSPKKVQAKKPAGAKKAKSPKKVKKPKVAKKSPAKVSKPKKATKPKAKKGAKSPKKSKPAKK